MLYSDLLNIPIECALDGLKIRRRYVTCYENTENLKSVKSERATG